MSFARFAHPLADVELIEAARWYESEQSGLGDDFLDAADDAVRSILDWPQIAPVFPGWNREPVMRTQSIKSFPYRVLYFLTDDELTIVAYAHNRRKPGYWKDRL